ncbi:unnamed protein product [Chrysoparadoxa australica]
MAGHGGEQVCADLTECQMNKDIPLEEREVVPITSTSRNCHGVCGKPLHGFCGVQDPESTMDNIRICKPRSRQQHTPRFQSASSKDKDEGEKGDVLFEKTIPATGNGRAFAPLFQQTAGKNNKKRKASAVPLAEKVTEEGEENFFACKSVSTKLTSRWWDYYECNHPSKIPDSVRCALPKESCVKGAMCQEWIMHSGNTSNLRSHIFSCHKSVFDERTDKDNKAREEKKQGNLQSYLEVEDHIDKMMSYVVHKHRPLSIVEDEDFRDMLRSFGKPAFRMDTKTLKYKLADKAACVAEGVKDMLHCSHREPSQDTSKHLMSQNSVALTTDGWSSDKDGFNSLTAHFIRPDWSAAQELTLSVEVMRDFHSAANLLQWLKDKLKKFGFPTDEQELRHRISGMTTDGGSPLATSKTVKIPFQRMTCWAHALNLVADTLLRRDKDVWPSLEKFRNVSKAFKKSPLQTNHFLAAQKQMNGKDKGALCMVLDVPTRWWSLLTSIDRWIQLKDHIIHWKAQQEANSSGSTKADESTPFAAVKELTTKDWMVIEHLRVALMHFKNAQVAMETSKHPSVSLVPMLMFALFSVLEEFIDDLKKKRGEYEDPCCAGYQAAHGVREALKRMHDDMKKRFGAKGTMSKDTRFFLSSCPNNQDLLPRMAWCAVALDPRTKKLPGVNPSQHKPIHDLVFSEAVDLQLRLRKDELQDLEAAADIQRVEAEMEEEGAEDASDEPSILDTMLSKCRHGSNSLSGQALQDRQEEPRSVDEITRAIKAQVGSEWHRFEKMCASSMNICPLVKWKIWKKHFPCLAELARASLCLQASSAASERVFSKASQVLTERRRSLDADQVSTLLSLENNWKPLKEWKLSRAMERKENGSKNEK